MNDKMHPRRVTAAIDLSAWHDESSALNKAKWYATNVAAELTAYEATMRPVQVLRKQLETLDPRHFMLATAEPTRFADMQISAGRAAASSMLAQVQLQADVVNAEARWGTLNSVASSDAPLNAYESVASAAAGLGALDSSAIAAATMGNLGSLSAYESVASAAAGLGGLEYITGAASKLWASDFIAGTAAKLREFDPAARAAARREILDSAVLARTRAIEEILTPSKSAAMYLEEMSGVTALQLAVDQAARWSDQHKEITTSLARFNEPLGISSARALLESMALASTPYGLRGLLEESAQLSDSEEVREEAYNLVQSVTDAVSRATTTQEAVDKIVQAILATKAPKSQTLLLAIFVPTLMALIFSFVNPVIDFYVKKWLEGTPKQEATKQVKETAREVVGDVRVLADYRFVTKQRLDLRSGPKAKAPAVGHLLFGQTVRILEKERDFTLVVWRSEDGKVELQGWVFSRYLKRFS